MHDWKGERHPSDVVHTSPENKGICVYPGRIHPSGEMTMEYMKETGKLIALALRHKPEVLNLSLDSHGWASTADLVAQLNKRQPFTMEMLEEIVRTDGKQRFSFNTDKTGIRANQGHSIPVDLDLSPLKPPEILWHGTGKKYEESIRKQGIQKQSRQYVHLSDCLETAVKVGQRHGKPVVFDIDAARMYLDGYDFYRSENGVWLTDAVPPKYIGIHRKEGTFSFAAWSRKNGFHFYPAVGGEYDEIRKIPEDILQLNPPMDYIRFFEKYDGGEGPLFGIYSEKPSSKDERLELFPLHRHRETSRSLFDSAINLQKRWENWDPTMDEEVRKLLDEALIIGRIGSPEGGWHHHIVFLRGYFYLTRRLIESFGVPFNCENMLLSSGNNEKDESFDGILEKAVMEKY